MKINKTTANKVIYPQNPSSNKQSLPQEKQSTNILEQNFKNLSIAANSMGIAYILLQECPPSIAKDIDSDNEMNFTDGIIDEETQKHIKHRFSKNEKVELLHDKEKIKQYPQIFKYLVKAKNVKDGKGRFDGYECAELFNYADVINKYPKAFFIIINAITSNNTPRFNSNQCCKLLDIADKIEQNQEAFKILISLNKYDETPLFDAKECIEMMKYGDLLEKTKYYIPNYVKIFNEEKKDCTTKQLINILEEKAKTIEFKEEKKENFINAERKNSKNRTIK